MSTFERRQTLASIIRGAPVANQDQLSERLKAAGHDVTQATVSRDLEALGAFKGKRDGKSAYLLPDQLAEHDGMQAELQRLLGEWRLSVEVAGNMIIMRTRPGSAHVVASALDHAQLKDVAGTIAGDDTLFIAVRDGHSPDALAARLGQ